MEPVVTGEEARSHRELSAATHLGFKVMGLPLGGRMHIVPTGEDMDAVGLLEAARKQPDRGIRVKCCGLQEIGPRWVVTWAELSAGTDRLHVVLIGDSDGSPISWLRVGVQVNRFVGTPTTYAAIERVSGPCNAIEIIQVVRNEDSWVVRPGIGRLD